MQEGILQFTAAAWACWGWQGTTQQPTWKAAQEIALCKPFSFKQADYLSLLDNVSPAACGRGKETSHFLKCCSDTFPKAFSGGTAGLEGSGFLLLFRMFHFTLNLEPGLRPWKSCFRATEENLLHSLLLFCKNRKLKAILIAACGAAASQWREGLLKIYWSAWLPSLILVSNNSAVRWLPPICKYLICACYCQQDRSRFLLAMQVSRPSVSKAKKASVNCFSFQFSTPY